MGSQKITQARIQTLEKLGEQAVFEKYLESKSVRAMMNELFEPHGEGAKQVGRTSFQAWLKEAEGRLERWEEVKAMKGDLIAEGAYETAMNSDESNVRSSKLKYDAQKWMASVLNARYAERQHHKHEHTVDFEDTIAQALAALDAEEPELIEAEVIDEEEA